MFGKKRQFNSIGLIEFNISTNHIANDQLDKIVNEKLIENKITVDRIINIDTIPNSIRQIIRIWYKKY